METKTKHGRTATARIDADIDRAVNVVRRDYGGDLQAYFNAVKDHIQNVRQHENDTPVVRPDGSESQPKLPS